MKKEVCLGVILDDKNIVTFNNSSYPTTGTYQTGCVEFIATIDGRRKTYNPRDAMEGAGLIENISGPMNMFPNYKATNKFFEVFESDGTFLSFAEKVKRSKKVLDK